MRYIVDEKDVEYGVIINHVDKSLLPILQMDDDMLIEFLRLFKIPKLNSVLKSKKLKNFEYDSSDDSTFIQINMSYDNIITIEYYEEEYIISLHHDYNLYDSCITLSEMQNFQRTYKIKEMMKSDLIEPFRKDLLKLLRTHKLKATNTNIAKFIKTLKCI